MAPIYETKTITLNTFALANDIYWHVTYYDKAMWEEPNSLDFATGVSVYLF